MRLEAVRAAATLRIKEVRIVNELLRLTEYDSAWKIKAHAIKGLNNLLFNLNFFNFHLFKKDVHFKSKLYRNF